MERLNNAITKLEDFYNGLSIGEDAIMPYDNNEVIIGWLKELKAYKDAEEQGLLLRLPVAIGSTIWYIGTECVWFKCDDYGDYCRAYCEKHKIPKIRSMVVRQYRIKNGYASITDCDAVCSSYEKSFCLNDIGKKWFLTRKEAEQALAEMQKG